MTPPIMRGGYRSRKRDHRPWFLFCNTKPPVRRVVLCYTKQRTAGLSLSSPVRVFEDVTGWGGSTEERVNNVEQRTDALESANDDLILMMADLIGG